MEGEMLLPVRHFRFRGVIVTVLAQTDDHCEETACEPCDKESKCNDRNGSCNWCPKENGCDSAVHKDLDPDYSNRRCIASTLNSATTQAVSTSGEPIDQTSKGVPQMSHARDHEFQNAEAIMDNA